MVVNNKSDQMDGSGMPNINHERRVDKGVSFTRAATALQLDTVLDANN